MKGLCKVVVPRTRSAVLVQESVHGDLALCVRMVACKVLADRLCHLHVWLHNASDTDIEVRKRQVIADVFTIREEYAVDRVMSHLQVSQSGKTDSTSPSRAPQEEHPLEFQFGEGTPAEWRAQFGGRLQAYQDVFTRHEFDLGKTDAVKFDIDLEPGPPIRGRPRPLPPRDFEEAKQHMQSLLDADIIAPSTSSFASPIVLVRQKSGGLRMCVDYRRLNARTAMDKCRKLRTCFLHSAGLGTSHPSTSAKHIIRCR